MLNPVYRHPPPVLPDIKLSVSKKDYHLMTAEEKKIFELSLEEKRNLDRKRKDESFLLEKGQDLKFNFGKKLLENEQQSEQLVDDAWKILFQNLVEQSILLKNSDIKFVVNTGIKLFKVLNEFNKVARAHAKSIIEELCLPNQFRLHQEIPNYDHEPITKMTFSDQRYRVTISLSHEIEAGLDAKKNGLTSKLIEDEAVVLINLRETISSLNF